MNHPTQEPRWPQRGFVVLGVPNGDLGLPQTAMYLINLRQAHQHFVVLTEPRPIRRKTKNKKSAGNLELEEVARANARPHVLRSAEISIEDIDENGAVRSP